MSTKTKNKILLAFVSTTFVLSIVSFATLQQQQVFAQEEVITEEEEEEEENEPGLANQSATEEDQKIILDDITIPIKSNTQLSIEMPDSKITVEPIK
jgi:CO dehydrogenase/acetyl-CoA synthase beta subunit